MNYDGPPATDWLTTPEDEQAQADYVTQFYTLLFSDPDVRAITWWDFSDKDSWLGAPSGMLRKDMSPKPVYDRLMALVHKAWWTNVSLPTDSHGRCVSHVFYGDYTVTATDRAGRSASVTVTLPEASGDKHIEIVLPAK
jgi:hypothetical protein